MKYSRCTSTSRRKFILVWDCKTCHYYSHPVKELAERYFKLKFEHLNLIVKHRINHFFTYRIQRHPNPLGIFGYTVPLTQYSRNVNWYLAFESTLFLLNAPSQCVGEDIKCMPDCSPNAMWVTACIQRAAHEVISTVTQPSFIQQRIQDPHPVCEGQTPPTHNVSALPFSSDHTTPFEGNCSHHIY